MAVVRRRPSGCWAPSLTGAGDRPVRRLPVYRRRPAATVLGHVACNLAAIAESSEQCNQPIGARLVLLADAVFRTRHRWESGALSNRNTCAGSRVTGKAGEAS